MKNIFTLTLAFLLTINMVKSQDPTRLGYTSDAQYLDPSMCYEVDQYLYYVIPVLNSFEVWRSDGTVNGTKKVFDLNQIYPNATGAPQGFISAGGKVFVSLQYNNDTSALITFTHQDLTPSVVKLFKSIPMGGNTSYKHLRPMIAYKNACWFGAEDFAPQLDLKGVELWSSDGTTSGTKMVADIIPGGTAGFYTSSVPSNFLVHNNKLYFSALKWTGSGQNYSFVLYESDGTEANTKPFSNGSITFSQAGAPFTAGAFKYKILNNTLFVSYRRPDNINQEEIYVYKVQEGGIPAARTFFRFGDFGFMNNKIIISGIPATKGILDPVGPELYTYDLDLSSASETLVKDINNSSPGLYIQAPFSFNVINNKLYMLANSGDFTTMQIWESDLTDAGTKPVTNFTPNPNRFHFSSYQLYQGNIYFNVYDSVMGNELHKLNTSTNAITHWDLFTGAENGVPNDGLLYSNNGQNLIIAGDILYFNAADSTYNYELWKLGTPSSSLKTVQENPSFSLYPNPCLNQINIQTKQAHTHIILSNVMGQSFRIEPNATGTYDIANIPLGFYICQIWNNDDMLISKKILKE